jgi:hypothetical protein
LTARRTTEQVLALALTDIAQWAAANDVVTAAPM